MKKQSTLLLLLATLFLFNSCAYESQFDLLGKPVKYNKLLIGNFDSDGTVLNIYRIDDYKVKVHYKSAADDVELKDAVGKFIQNGDKLYVVVKEDTKYIVGRILNISSQELKINMLDTDEDEVGESKTFKSAQDFTQFVFTNKSIFSEEFNETFTRN